MKKFLLPIILIAIVGIGAYVGWVKINEERHIPDGCKDAADKVACVTDSEPHELNTDLSNISSWKTYNSAIGEFHIKYPENFAVREAAGKITLEHAWPLHHDEPCDFKGGAPAREKLTDFSATLEVVKSSMKDIVKKNETDFLVTDYFKNDRFRLSPDFIDEFAVGNLRGYKITSGVEGCGSWRYYFPLDANTTVVVNRDFGEFLSLAGIRATYGANPLAILPDQADEIFNRILSSFYYYGFRTPSDKLKTYRNEEIGVEFKYPENLQMKKNEVLGIVRAGFSMLGPTLNQIPEPNDAFTFEVWRESYSDSSFDKFIDRKRKEAEQDGVSLVREIIVAGYKSITFGNGGLVWSENIYIPVQSGEVVGITYVVLDPTKVGFQKIVDDTIKSLEIID